MKRSRLVLLATSLGLAILLSGCGSSSQSPPSLLSITPSTLPQGVVNVSYTATVSATGGMTPYAWNVASGNLPPGFSLSRTGVLSGIATASGSFSFSVAVADSQQPPSVTSGNFSITIAGPPPVGITVMPTSAVAQSGTSVQFTAPVTNSTNQAVVWQVNGVTGGSSSLGTISSSGMYTAPAAVTDSANVGIAAISQADVTKSATATVTVFAPQRLGVRMVNGRGEFFDHATGTSFVPRGNDYALLDVFPSVRPNDTTYYHSTFNPGRYDASGAEAALTQMQSLGYNTAKVWLNIWGAAGESIGDPAGGLSAAYMANLADFLERARSHDIFVTITSDGIARLGGYVDLFDPTCNFAQVVNPSSVLTPCDNGEFLTANGIKAEQRFWSDLIRDLAQQHAPMDVIFGYEIREEFDFPQDYPPFDSTSGTFTAANGQTYDLSSVTSRQQLMNDGIAYWAYQTRNAIQQIAPNALVAVGFWGLHTPGHPPFSAIAGSTADFIDFHPFPDGVNLLSTFVTAWGMNGFGPKPVVMGEIFADKTDFATIALAAAALKTWQIDSCNYGFQGWLLWTWNETPRDGGWTAVSGNGEVNQALAPQYRANPCVP